MSEEERGSKQLKGSVFSEDNKSYNAEAHEWKLKKREAECDDQTGLPLLHRHVSDNCASSQLFLIRLYNSSIVSC